MSGYGDRYSDPLDSAFEAPSTAPVPREPPYFAGLNKEQREAVEAVDGPVLDTLRQAGLDGLGLEDSFRKYFMHHFLSDEYLGKDEVREGRSDLGLVIHEGQLTFGGQGLVKVLDLGAWWKEETGLPLPLGGNAVRLVRRQGRDAEGRTPVVVHRDRERARLGGLGLGSAARVLERVAADGAGELIDLEYSRLLGRNADRTLAARIDRPGRQHSVEAKLAAERTDRCEVQSCRSPLGHQHAVQSDQRQQHGAIVRFEAGIELHIRCSEGAQIGDGEETFELPGVPIRLMLREKENPYAGRAKRKN